VSDTLGQRILKALIVAAIAVAVLVVLYAAVMLILVALGVWGGA
jgi:hypothetical protein